MSNPADDRLSLAKLVLRIEASIAIACCVSIKEQLLRRNVKRFRGGLACKALRLCVLNSRRGGNKEEEVSRGPCSLEPALLQLARLSSLGICVLLSTHRNVHRFRGRLVFKTHRLLYHSTLGLRVITKK